MVRSQELAVRTNLSIGTNGDYATIEHRAIVVDEHVLTQFDAMTMVAMTIVSLQSASSIVMVCSFAHICFAL